MEVISENSRLNQNNNHNFPKIENFKNKISSLLEIDELNQIQINSFGNFVNFQILLNSKISSFFAEEIKGESTEFKNIVNQSTTSNTFKGFKTEDSTEKERLQNILLRKKEIYLAYLLDLLEGNKLEKILNKEDIETLKIIIKSGFLQIIDELFLNNPNKKIARYEKPEKQVYGFLTLNLDEISFAKAKFKKFKKLRKDLSEIPNENIRKYLINFFNLSISGNTNYADFIALEKEALNTWDKESNLGFMHPLEDYELAGYTDLEFSFILKDTSEGVNNPEFYSDLFTKYFASDYSAKKISVFNVEKFFSNGNASFMSVQGQAFPNDIDSKKEFGNKITVYNSNIRKSIGEIYPLTRKVVCNLELLDEEKLTEYDCDFTIAHEFAHSLFRNGYKSEFEEAKASYGYILKLYDKYQTQEISDEEFKYIITNLLLEIVKQAKRDGISSYRKYILYAKMALASLVNLGVLEFNNNEISINYDKNKFKDFLESGLDTLNLLKKIYENNEKEVEEKLIKIIEENIKEKYQIILTKIKES
ncbi:MAG: hypothetical protein PHG82_01970 [Candidatus Gracilibacteria bacterium]|nr:hypothetical protein [Candidatus Gracilibacteria bacterium]